MLADVRAQAHLHTPSVNALQRVSATALKVHR